VSGVIIAFPTLQERDDREFRRKGTSSYIRAIDDAEALWRTLACDDRPADFAARLDGLAGQVGQLEADRPEVAGDLIALGGVMVELRIAPRLLAAMAVCRAN